MNPFQNLKKNFTSTEQKKRELQNVSSEAQRLAKQSIFSAHREELEKSQKLLKESLKKLEGGRRILKTHPMLDNEGM